MDFVYRDLPLISGFHVRNLTFHGFTLTGTMGNAIHFQGDGIVLQDIHIFNIDGNGILCEGSYNQISGCDISHTGRGGIILKGGDRNTLTSGCNRAYNNYIHDYSEVYQTYQPGIQLEGVGNQCDHNEICDSPHMAIGYHGNEHLIEYNDIHHVVQQSSDAGAIYAGYDWAAHGTVIRYNLLKHIGSGEFTPDGIYWDDGHSGQTAYGNILIDVRKYSFLAGGGRENVIEGNVIIDSGAWPIHYDDRNRDGFLHNGWAHQATCTPDSPQWQHLRQVPYDSLPWRVRYPRLAALRTDFDDPDDPNFPINPAYSSVCYNVIIDARADTFDWKDGIAESVFRYSTVSGNCIYKTAEEAKWDPEVLEFTPDSPVFREIPSFKNPPSKGIGRIPG